MKVVSQFYCYSTQDDIVSCHLYILSCHLSQQIERKMGEVFSSKTFQKDLTQRFCRVRLPYITPGREIDP